MESRPPRTRDGTIRYTGRAEGDLGSLAERGPLGPSSELVARRQAIAPGPWTWLRQVHGAGVVEVVAPGDRAGAEADAAVTAHPDAVLCILTADCAPLAFTSAEGVRGVAHAGWRGLAEGVIAATVAAMRRAGASTIEASLGPCIHPECYEFSADDLEVVASRLGDHVRATTAAGRPALDLPNAVRTELARAGAVLTDDRCTCTACEVDVDGSWRWFSHRARGDVERQALVSVGPT